jgi:tetratricopeptide (TPR) repeat protein
VNTEAYKAFLQGRYFLGRRNKENLAKAADYFEQAIMLDPKYAPAWEGLGTSLNNQAVLGYVPMEEGVRKAREAVERALVLQPSLVGAHTAMAFIKMTHDWDWAGADASFRRALELEPGNANAIGGAGLLAWVLGRLDEAIELYRQALDIDPLRPNLYGNYALILICAGRQAEATATLKKTGELFPEMVGTNGMLARIYLMQSHAQEALAEAEKERHPIYRLWTLALAYHALERKKESDSNLAELIEKFQAQAPYQIAAAYAFRGETDLAFTWLDRAYTARDSGLDAIKTDPLLESVRRDPRYAAFLKKMRLV